MRLRTSVFAGMLTVGGLLVGCSTPTEITTVDGQTVTSPDKPELNDNDDFVTYEKDGKEVQVNKNEVRRIEEVK